MNEPIIYIMGFMFILLFLMLILESYDIFFNLARGKKSQFSLLGNRMKEIEGVSEE